MEPLVVISVNGDDDFSDGRILDFASRIAVPAPGSLQPGRHELV
jgi:hypothetical protein